MQGATLRRRRDQTLTSNLTRLSSHHAKTMISSTVNAATTGSSKRQKLGVHASSTGSHHLVTPFPCQTIRAQADLRVPSDRGRSRSMDPQQLRLIDPNRPFDHYAPQLQQIPRYSSIAHWRFFVRQHDPRASSPHPQALCLLLPQLLLPPWPLEPQTANQQRRQC